MLMRWFIPVLAACLLPVTGLAEEVSREQVEARLQELEAELSKYRELLEETESQKSDIEKSLEHNEKSINKLINRIDDIEEEIDTGEDKVSSLESEQKELVIARTEQQMMIERQVRAAYEIGNQEYLKVLLNQEDPVELDRMLTYYDYFNRARAREVERYNGTLVELDRVSAELNQQIAALGETRDRLQKQRSSLAALQREKEQNLEALISQIRAAGTEINRLEEDRAQLENLLERIQRSIANLPVPGDAEPFEKLQGRMLMPVAGAVSHGFGHQRNQGKMRWQGVFIDAEAGEPVHAVHYGRVVFSDWLRGFGLLLIVSHGEGYMSLYGHNEALYRETGDWVTAGEVIATVGNTGGQTRYGLYFEIRKSGKPTDPQKWCVARQHGTA